MKSRVAFLFYIDGLWYIFYNKFTKSGLHVPSDIRTFVQEFSNE